MAKQVSIRVPASAANLGPGFDSLGLALSLYHHLHVVEAEGRGLELRAAGEGAGTLPRDESNLVVRSMNQAFARARYEPGHLLVESNNGIPLACGLGSSAAARLAGLAAGMLLSTRELDRDALLEWGVAAEGHPDNAVPALVGGFTAAAFADAKLNYVRLEVPQALRAVVVVPNFSLSTHQSRRVLPREVRFEDAVKNQARTALLTAALAAGRLELLRPAMEDCLHQPYRAALVPGLEAVRRAALEAGALGSALCGAGASMLALLQRADEAVGAAMQAAWRRRGIESRLLKLNIDRKGLRAATAEREEQ